MVATLIFSVIASFAIYQILSKYRGLQRNIALAKSSGLPVVVAPWYTFSILWLSTFKLWLPLLQRFLPQSWRGMWFDLLNPEWSYTTGHGPFDKMGMDVFMVASPTRNVVFVADAEAVTQITTRRNDFPKPLEMYTSLDIYGKNLVSTEGSDWRTHRKLVAPSFGDKNNQLVFNETLHHAKSMLGLWAGSEGKGNQTIADPSIAAMNFALYVISGAGFDVRVVWPHEEGKKVEDKKSEDSIFVGSEAPPGYTMSYRAALSQLLHNIMWTQVMPLKWLARSPVKMHREVSDAAHEWGKYMDEIYEMKKTQVEFGETQANMDIFDSLIRGSGITKKEGSNFTKSDLLGNAFVLMLAGHETTANTLHFSMVFLAMNWGSQKRLQDDIDNIFAGKPIDEWKYEEHFQKLFASMPAAVMNETLRLLQPIINIPKSTPPGRPQPLNIGGKQYMVPGDAHVFLSAAIHRNPKYWPTPSDGSSKDDLDQFRPERWLVDSKPDNDFVDINYDDEGLRGPAGEDTSSELFKPVKGSYIPFSDGFRSCIGRRFAQVEILAVLAAIFSQYSVELAVDDFASDEEVEKMPKGGKERRDLYKMATDRAQDLIQTKMASIITLQLRGVSIPIRLMKRGEERFAFDV